MKPFWNILSLAIPMAAALVGILMLLSGNSSRGDFAGRLGNGVLFFVGIGVACVIGEGAAIWSLVRGERLPWIAGLGVIGNLLVIIPLLGVWLRD